MLPNPEIKTGKIIVSGAATNVSRNARHLSDRAPNHRGKIPFLLASISCLLLWPIVDGIILPNQDIAKATVSSSSRADRSYGLLAELYRRVLPSDPMPQDERETQLNQTLLQLEAPAVSNPPRIKSEPKQPFTKLNSAPVKASLSAKELADKVFSIIRNHAGKRVDAHFLSRAIVSEAAAQQYDPLFVAAVIKSESMFNALARSNVGAQGLMQVMPATGKWLADNFYDPKGYSRGNLTDPGYNLKLGITYLKHLEELYSGDRVFTLIAYNWGPGRVEYATTKGRSVPIEVMQYALKILNDYRRWKTEM